MYCDFENKQFLDGSGTATGHTEFLDFRGCKIFVLRAFQEKENYSELPLTNSDNPKLGPGQTQGLIQSSQDNKLECPATTSLTNSFRRLFHGF